MAEMLIERSFHALHALYRSHSEFNIFLTFPDRNLTDNRKSEENIGTMELVVKTCSVVSSHGKRAHLIWLGNDYRPRKNKGE